MTKKNLRLSDGGLNFGGAEQNRTDDPLHAMQVLYQLSYGPTKARSMADASGRRQALHP